MGENKATQIVLTPIDQIKPWPKNPNKHSPDQIERLVEIIKQQGFRSPLVVSKRSGLLIVGHGRLEAATHLGFKSLPVIFQDFESEEQEYAYCVADNAIADWATLDQNMIKAEVLDFGPDFDLDLLGFKDIDILNSQAFDNDDNESPDYDEKKYIIEVSFPNDCEMNDIKDDLIHRGYIVKVK